MASAGRILIMPKGNYDSSVTYEMLDLVYYNGASWLAKKTVVGIAPTDESSEYWMKMCSSADLSEILGRIAAIENQMISVASLDDEKLSVDMLGKSVLATDLFGKYSTPTFVQWNSTTLNTPKQFGLTGCVEGFAIVHGDISTYHTVSAWTLGGGTVNYFIHQVNEGKDLGWGTFLNTTGGTLTGELKINKSNPRIQMKNESNSRHAIFESNSDGVTSMGNWKSNEDQTNLQLRKSSEGLENLLKLTVNGENSYKIFGEHNITAISNALAGKISGVKIATGEYIGDGRYSQSNGDIQYTIIRPGFEAKIIFITTEENDATYDSPTIWITGMKKALRKPIISDSKYFIYFDGNGSELKMYGFYAAYFQHNTKDAKYRWVAIG